MEEGGDVVFVSSYVGCVESDCLTGRKNSELKSGEQALLLLLHYLTMWHSVSYASSQTFVFPYL